MYERSQLETRVNRLFDMMPERRLVPIALGLTTALAGLGSVTMLPAAEIIRQRSPVVMKFAPPIVDGTTNQVNEIAGNERKQLPPPLGRDVGIDLSAPSPTGSPSAPAATGAQSEANLANDGLVIKISPNVKPEVSIGPTSGSGVNSQRIANIELASRQTLDLVGNNPAIDAYADEMRSLGFVGLDGPTLSRFKQAGVSRGYVGEMSALGYSGLSPKLILAFREAGVSADYIRKMRSLLVGSISATEIIALRDGAVTPEFVADMRKRGVQSVTARQLINIRD
jgi:hypothetical protein